jgi:porphobilinogen synthase
MSDAAPLLDLPHRFRRLRRSASLRALVRETRLSTDDLILPLFVEEGVDAPVPIPSMPGVVRHTEAGLAEAVAGAWANGIRAVILFGVSNRKDAEGSDSWHPEGLMVRMIRSARAAAPGMVVISDNCFCEYTDHGHCGVIHGDDVLNDATLRNLQRQALAAARAGVDMLAPSGMMDGMVRAMRQALDAEGFTQLPIMSYSTKFASAFYGPFRDAVDSSFKGTRAAYQMDVANGREALAESLQDEVEGADILMVKPGLACLDVIAAIRAHTRRPLAVYQVSGEYAMIKAAAAAGVMDERALVMETMTAFRRAGADMVITYYAERVAEWLRAG